MLFREDNVARADADAIRKGVGFYRWTHDIVEITGKDALEVLQKIYISNISKVAVGRSKYTASLDENGEIIDDVIVMHMADGLYWVSDLYGPRLLPWIEKHKGTADIQTKIITYDWDMYAIQGPDSINAMNAMLDKPIDELKRFGICERKIGDIPVYIHRSGFTGENGYEIYSDGPLPLIKISLVKRQHWRVKNIRNIVWSVLNFHVNQQKISPSGSVYTGTVWKSAAVHRQSTAIQSTKTLVLPPSALTYPMVRS